MFFNNFLLHYTNVVHVTMLKPTDDILQQNIDNKLDVALAKCQRATIQNKF